MESPRRRLRSAFYKPHACSCRYTSDTLSLSPVRPRATADDAAVSRPWYSGRVYTRRVDRVIGQISTLSKLIVLSCSFFRVLFLALRMEYYVDGGVFLKDR